MDVARVKNTHYPKIYVLIQKKGRKDLLDILEASEKVRSAVVMKKRHEVSDGNHSSDR